MFDIGFIELLLCAVIALLVLGPERLPVAARATGRWIGKARRMARTFTSELDRQLKADELREKIRKEGSELGAEEIQRNFQKGLSQARKYTDYVITDDQAAAPSSGPASPGNAAPDKDGPPDSPPISDPPRQSEPETEPALKAENATETEPHRDPKSQETQHR
jgi:sec-independent protein translocase protein TatB